MFKIDDNATITVDIDVVFHDNWVFACSFTPQAFQIQSVNVLISAHKTHMSETGTITSESDHFFSTNQSRA